MGQGAQGPPGPPGPPGQNGKSITTTDLISNPEFLSSIRELLINDVNFKNQIQDFFKDKATLFKGEKGIGSFSDLTESEQTAVVAQLFNNHFKDLIKDFDFMSNVQTAIINDQKFQQFVKDYFVQNEALFKGAPGQGVSAAELLGNSEYISRLQTDLMNHPRMKLIIDTFLKTNAGLFKGEKGDSVTVANLVSNNVFLSELQKQLINNASFILQITDFFNKNASTFKGRDGAPGRDGIQEADIKQKVMWCADGNICKVPTSTTAIDFSNKNIRNVNRITANEIGAIDGAKFTSGWGGFVAGYLVDGNDVSKGFTNSYKLTRDGIYLGKNWRIWENNQGELEFKNEKENKWFLAKNI